MQTTTFVQRDLPADGMTDQSTIPVVEKAEVQMTLPSNYANLPDSSTGNGLLRSITWGNDST